MPVAKRFLLAAIAVPMSLLFSDVSLHVVATSATSFTYRLRTTAKAFWQVYFLPQEDLDRFLTSFEIWDRVGLNTASDFEAGVPLNKFCANHSDAATVVDYYSVLNRLCALGNVEKMYIPPMMDQKRGVFDNQLLYERSFASKLAAGKDSQLLELGCGRGRITYNTAMYTGATITAMNIEPDQLAAAKAFAASQGLNGTQLNFILGNYNDALPFADESFDAVYEVQALTYAWDLKKLFAEIARVLKPGGILSVLDGVMLDGFDPSNATQIRLLHETRQVTGLGGYWHTKYWRDAVSSAGFDILEAGVAGEIPYQYPMIDSERWIFESLTELVRWLTRLRMLPLHFLTLLERFTAHGDSFTTMDREELFTTSYAIIARKRG